MTISQDPVKPPDGTLSTSNKCVQYKTGPVDTSSARELIATC